MSEVFKSSKAEQLIIRSMKIGDYDQVYTLWLSCAGMGLNNVDDSLVGIEKFLQRNPTTCFVAELKSRIIGVIMAGNDGRRGFVYHTAVSPDFRRRGIGEKLVKQAIESLQKLGIAKVALVVFDKNQLANEFWEKQGFTIRDDLVYRNKTLVEMRRTNT